MLALRAAKLRAGGLETAPAPGRAPACLELARAPPPMAGKCRLRGARFQPMLWSMNQQADVEYEWLDTGGEMLSRMLAAIAEARQSIRLEMYIVRAGAMAAVFLAFRFGYRRLRGREGMGLGDVKLAGVAGIWLDWPSLPNAVEIAALGALAFLAVARIRTRRAPDPLAKLPFGTFFAPAIWTCWALERWWNWTL